MSLSNKCILYSICLLENNFDLKKINIIYNLRLLLFIFLMIMYLIVYYRWTHNKVKISIIFPKS